MSFQQIFDTLSNHVFGSWTDVDLYRAIDNPEIKTPGPAQDAEIAEYVEELRKRQGYREREANRREELREKYRL